MFTGLVEEVGTVLSLRSAGDGTQLQVSAPAIAELIRLGESVAVNGCCLTVTARQREQLTFDLLQETLGRTNLRTLRPGTRVNLERALAVGDRLGGHFVQGHVDATIRVLGFDESGADHRLEVELPPEFAHYVAFKGSLAINGISLTVAEVLPASCAVWIIPHTRQHTNLHAVAPGDWLNVEFDLLAKYVERMVTRPA